MSIGKAVMQIVLIVFLSSALIIGSMARVRAAQECTLDQSNQAEQTIGGLSTWDQVFVSFKYYKQCDDGAVAEGYDDKIVSLLVSHWDTFDDLQRLAADNPSFEEFVLKHIDTLMSPEDAKHIVKNADTRCPVDARELCARLANKAKNPE
jgi:hypothetical protein